MINSNSLYDCSTGCFIHESCVTRFPRHRQIPYISEKWIELSAPMDSFPSFNQAVYLPFCSTRSSMPLLTETLAFLWPFCCKNHVFEKSSLPVILNQANSDDIHIPFVFDLIRGRGHFPSLPEDLPSCLIIKEAYVPGPSMRLHSYCDPLFITSFTKLVEPSSFFPFVA